MKGQQSDKIVRIWELLTMDTIVMRVLLGEYLLYL